MIQDDIYVELLELLEVCFTFLLIVRGCTGEKADGGGL